MPRYKHQTEPSDVFLLTCQRGHMDYHSRVDPLVTQCAVITLKGAFQIHSMFQLRMCVSGWECAKMTLLGIKIWRTKHL